MLVFHKNVVKKQNPNYYWIKWYLALLLPLRCWNVLEVKTLCLLEQGE